MFTSTTLLFADNLNLDILELGIENRIVISASGFENGHFIDEFKDNVTIGHLKDMHVILGEFIRLYEEKNNLG
jgi:hypothetical protein